MRKLIMFNLISIDGFFAGPNGELDWHNVDEEFNNFALEQLDEIDILIFGRKTYELMAGYWSTEAAINDDPKIAEKMNSTKKIIFSHSDLEIDWSNSILATHSLEQVFEDLKTAPGKDIAIFGSANLCSSLIAKGLIDEFRILVNPVVLGKGMPLFMNLEAKLDLILTRVRNFKSGNVLLTYHPNKKI